MSSAIDLGKFSYVALPVRAIFGAGRAAELGAELERLGVRRAMLCTTPRGPERYRALISGLGPLAAGVFAGAEPHCPEPVVKAAIERFRALDADGAVAIGGGSTVGLGKWISAETGKPFVAVPTTLSGSEMTPILGVKVGAEKRTRRDPKALARTVIYDPALTLALPAHETATTGMNSLAHCVEALYPAEPNPVARLIALDGIRALFEGLPASVARPGDLAARSRALYGGFLGGLLVQLVGIGLHHKICHVLGGKFGAPHGETNSVMLAQVVAFNAPYMPEVMSDLRAATGGADPAAAIFDLAKRMGAPVSLEALGIDPEGLEAAARDAVAQTVSNPRPLDAAGVHALLREAWHGRRPS
ncbi:MAG TPA: maleylacetate reductase [Stellaceae bacterium]|nr:maleylacetate reductase [Stellaceae bacterium]